MSSDPLKDLHLRTPPTEPIPGREHQMAQNAAGGVTFTIDDWTRLHRFLIMGVDSGTYYETPRKLAVQSAGVVRRLFDAGEGVEVIKRTVEVSRARRAPRESPALFVLAMGISIGDADTKRAASDSLPLVARIPTFLFEFIEYALTMRGYGYALRRSLQKWLEYHDTESLALHAVKYRQREGWTWKRLLQVSHPKPKTELQQLLFAWMKHGSRTAALEGREHQLRVEARTAETEPRVLMEWPPELSIIEKFDALQVTALYHPLERAEAIKILSRDRRLTWEMLPTQHLAHADTWRALLPALNMGALVRQLPTLTRRGVIGPMTPETNGICNRLSDPEAIRGAGLHPFRILTALKTYSSGRGRSATWTPDPRIVQALETAFDHSFAAVERIPGRTYIAVDVSSSMRNAMVSGLPLVSACEGAAVLSMLFARRSDAYVIRGFCDKMVDLQIHAGMTFGLAAAKCQQHNFGGTDASKPIIDARKSKIPVDTFLMITDAENWAGLSHPVQELRDYRKTMKLPTKMITVSMCNNGHTVADPDDGGMMDVVGFDTYALRIITDFISQ